MDGDALRTKVTCLPAQMDIRDCQNQEQLDSEDMEQESLDFTFEVA